jgi:uncharacterized protein (DUF4415 family)
MVRKAKKSPPEYGTPDDDIPEMTAADFSAAQSVADAMPDLIAAAKRARGRPKAANPLMQISIRVDKNVLAAFKAQGSGWQEKMRAALARAAARLPQRKPKHKRAA